MGKILDALKKAEKEAMTNKKEAEHGEVEKTPLDQPKLPPLPKETSKDKFAKTLKQAQASAPSPEIRPPAPADSHPEQQVPVQPQEVVREKPVESIQPAQTDADQPEPPRARPAPPEPTSYSPKQPAPVQRREELQGKPVERRQADQNELAPAEIRRSRPAPPSKKKDYLAMTQATVDEAELGAKKIRKRFFFFKDHKKEPYTLYYPNSLVSEQFRMLRSRLSRMAQNQPIKTILVTSTLSGEGKSFVASNLAITIARGLDEKVLLVDVDFRNPSQHQLFQLPTEKGLSDFLISEQSLEDLIQKTTVPNLNFLASGSQLKNPAELIASEAMKYFFDEVRYQYPDHFIIFDSTPVLQTSESILLAEQVDGVLFVVEAGKTDKPLVNNAIEILGKEKIIGIIFNSSTIPVRSYYGYQSSSTR